MTIFTEELQSLNERILKMGCLVEEAIKNSIHALTDRNNALAQNVLDKEPRIDALDVEIDEECIRLIALREPKAADLRFITTAMKVTSELERMGDLAVNIAERATELNEEPELKPYIDIPKMSEIAQSMTRDVLDALVQRDAQAAAAVIARDDEIDRLNIAVMRELSFLTNHDPSGVNRAIKISLVAHYLERIADHTTNIAEMLIYLVKGTIVKHPDLTPDNQGLLKGGKMTEDESRSMATGKKIKVLFVCIHNSARSQMAEAFLNQLAGDRFEAQSAGLEPGVLNPLAVEVMREAGIDISTRQTKSVWDLFKLGAIFNYVITVCDEASAESCPIFPGITKRLHWSFADPSTLFGSHEEKLAAARLIRDEIRQSVVKFINEKSA